MTEFISFDLKVVNPDGASFEKILQPLDNSNLFGTFQTTASYSRPGEILEEGSRTLQFFFQDNALPNGDSIFNQEIGKEFTVGTPMGQLYDGQSVRYEEFKPNHVEETPPFWEPTSFAGKVRIIEADVVEFDLVFTDDIESREVMARYQFFTHKTQHKIGNCD